MKPSTYVFCLIHERYNKKRKEAFDETDFSGKSNPQKINDKIRAPRQIRIRIKQHEIIYQNQTPKPSQDF